MFKKQVPIHLCYSSFFVVYMSVKYMCKVYVCVFVLFHLELSGHDQFRSLQPHKHVQTHKRHDGHEDGEVTDELPDLKSKTKQKTAGHQRAHQYSVFSWMHLSQSFPSP